MMVVCIFTNILITSRFQDVFDLRYCNHRSQSGEQEVERKEDTKGAQENAYLYPGRRIITP